MKTTLLDAALALISIARGHIRSRTRTPKYLEHGDRFAAILLGKPLGIAPDYYRAVGTEIAVILDTCYEELIPAGEHAAALLSQLTHQLESTLDPELAARDLPLLRARLDVPECPLPDVACAIVSAITILGHTRLVERTSAEVAGVWLSLWQSSAGSHNRRQEVHSGLCALGSISAEARARVLTELKISATDLQPVSTTFSAGVREYLAKFSESSAAAMTIVGALPFAEKLSNDDLASLIGFLDTTPAALKLLDGVMRFAQDVRFDNTEPMSTGVAALAAERCVSVPDFDVQSIDTAALESRLRQEWVSYARESRDRLDRLFAALPPAQPVRQILEEIAGATFTVADVLAGTPYKV